MSFRWEEELRQHFVANANPSLWCSARAPTHIYSRIESTCSEGRADWVWAHMRMAPSEQLDSATCKLLQQPTCSRMLACIRVNQQVSREELLQKSGVSPTTARRHLNLLLQYGLVTGCNAQFTSGPLFQIPDMEVCAFEFKLYHWRRALQQARRYRAFAHRAYVVMPPDAVALAMEQRDLFDRANIGLISYSPDGRAKRWILSRKGPPARTERFLQAAGFLFDQDYQPKLMRLPNSANALAHAVR